jgi:surface polysaccharide O-acyltransferase-like enzyme
VFFMLAAAIRWRAARSRLWDALSHRAFGMYVLHYAPLVWLQYSLLELQASAFLKASLVLAGTAGASYVGASAIAWVSRGARSPARAPAQTRDA